MNVCNTTYTHFLDQGQPQSRREHQLAMQRSSSTKKHPLGLLKKMLKGHKRTFRHLHSILQNILNGVLAIPCFIL